MKNSTWSVHAKNLPEHARNPIHTDEGGRAAGFNAALVAGVTVYAYLTNPVVTQWGVDWLRKGSSFVEFKSPILANELVECVSSLGKDTLEVNANVNGETRARCHVSMNNSNSSISSFSLCESLEPENIHLVNQWEDYGSRAGDDHKIYSELGIIHPSIWPSLANHVVEQKVAKGAWIHTRSKIFHYSLVEVGSIVTVEPKIINRFETLRGSRATLDVSISIAGKKVINVEHEAIISLKQN